MGSKLHVTYSHKPTEGALLQIFLNLVCLVTACWRFSASFPVPVPSQYSCGEDTYVNQELCLCELNACGCRCSASF